MVSVPAPVTTLAEFLALPETKPASEFLDGQIIQKPMPKFHHSILQIQLASLINRLAQPPKLGFAFPELRCTFGEVSIVPDIIVLRWQHIPFLSDGTIADTFMGVPDWLIEILSPDQSPLRVMHKIGTAITHGAQLGWLIIPQRQAVLVYTGDDIPLLIQGDDPLPVLDILSGWEIKASELFQLLHI